MKNYSIIIFRHGKSDWNAVYGKDHDRPLSKRGINASKKMGIFLKKNNGIIIDSQSFNESYLRIVKINENIVIENLEVDINEKLFFSPAHIKPIATPGRTA